MSSSEPNRWKGLVLGAVGAVPAMIAMDYFWKVVYSLQSSSSSSSGSEASSSPHSGEWQQKHHILSPSGRHFKPGESSTAAMGSLVYKRITGHAPQSQETITMLSNVTDWGFGMLMGGLYGAFRDRSKVLDIKDELLYSTGLWLTTDEIGVPLAGLSWGPRAYPLSDHLESWGAHIVYGLVMATTTKILDRIL